MESADSQWSWRIAFFKENDSQREKVKKDFQRNESERFSKE